MKKATVLFMMMVLFCGCDTTRGNSGAEEWWGPRKWDGDSGDSNVTDIVDIDDVKAYLLVQQVVIDALVKQTTKE